jgi:hypothetical protein
MADRLDRPAKPQHATEDRAAEPPITAAVGVAGRPRTVGGRPAPHADKFRLVTAALVGLAVGALVIAAALIVAGGGQNASDHWSSWSPQDGGRQGVAEIAAHVAPLYRLSASQQLDLVTQMDIADPSANGSGGGGGGYTVAINQSGTGTTLSVLTGKTVAYDLCGTGGSQCQLAGTPSADRLLLLKREALELALYTFKYVSGTQNVIAVLPPGRAASTLSKRLPSPQTERNASRPVTIAVLFVRQELQPWLEQPLATTLNQFPPALSELTLWRQTTEAGLVDEITGHGLFAEKVEQAQDGSKLLVLTQQAVQ